MERVDLAQQQVLEKLRERPRPKGAGQWTDSAIHTRTASSKRGHAKDIVYDPEAQEKLKQGVPSQWVKEVVIRLHEFDVPTTSKCQGLFKLPPLFSTCNRSVSSNTAPWTLLSFKWELIMKAIRLPVRIGGLLRIEVSKHIGDESRFDQELFPDKCGKSLLLSCITSKLINSCSTKWQPGTT